MPWRQEVFPWKIGLWDLALVVLWSFRIFFVRARLQIMSFTHVFFLELCSKHTKNNNKTLITTWKINNQQHTFFFSFVSEERAAVIELEGDCARQDCVFECWKPCDR